MKRCPTCNKTYNEENLSFCIDDGTPLVPVSNDDATVATPRFSDDRNTHDRAGDWKANAYQPPSYVSPAGTPQRRVWPWVVGIVGILLLGLIGLSVAAVLILPRMIRNSQSSRETPVANYNTNSKASPNENTNSDSNSNNANSAVGEKPANSNSNAPSDNDLVLAQLTNLEHEWTVANINADKKALNRILADDYAGPDGSGHIQGKADYLKNISRDSSIQKWEFKNLKVSLRGDRATLSGTLILRQQNQDRAYSFVDKFVWRDGRWQATGSVVTPMQQGL